MSNLSRRPAWTSRLSLPRFERRRLKDRRVYLRYAVTQLSNETKVPSWEMMLLQVAAPHQPLEIDLLFPMREWHVILTATRPFLSRKPIMRTTILQRATLHLGPKSQNSCSSRCRSLVLVCVPTLWDFACHCLLLLADW